MNMSMNNDNNHNHNNTNNYSNSHINSNIGIGKTRKGGKTRETTEIERARERKKTVAMKFAEPQY